MKSYADLHAESPRAFLRKLEEDLKAIEARLARLETGTAAGLSGVLKEYERLALAVEQKAYDSALARDWSWDAERRQPRLANIYPSERLPDGLTFAWTGPAPFVEIAAMLMRDVPLECRIAYMKFFEEDMADGFVATVDGSPVKTTVTPSRISFRVPPRSRQALEPTMIAFGPSAVGAPVQDGRALGLALFSVEISPVAAESSDA